MTAYADDPDPTSVQAWIVDADRRATEPLVDGDKFNVAPDGTVHADPKLLRARREREPDLDKLRAEREPSVDALIAERDGTL